MGRRTRPLPPAPTLTPEQADYLSDLPPMSFPRGVATTHPMYRQWRVIVDGCTNPLSPGWKTYGAKNVTIASRWMKFENFLADMADAWDGDLSKPLRFRRIYLSRAKLKAGFNKANTIWVTKEEAARVQGRTEFVKTPWGSMTLRELHRYLHDHAGEDLPEGHGPYTLMMRQFDPVSGRFVTESVKITTISPATLDRLRKRHSKGQDLLRPARPYGEVADRLADAVQDVKDRDRARREEKARELGMSLMEYDNTHRADGSRIDFEAARLLHAAHTQRLAAKAKKGVED